MRPRPSFPKRDGQLTTIRKSKRTEEEQEEEDEQPQEEIYGSKRYGFEPYATPVSGEALQAAHQHIGFLHRLSKWQGKQIRKLVKTVKDIKRKFKSQSRRRAEDHVTQEAGSSSRATKGKAPLSPSSSDSGNPSYSMESSSPSPSP